MVMSTKTTRIIKDGHFIELGEDYFKKKFEIFYKENKSKQR